MFSLLNTLYTRKYLACSNINIFHLLKQIDSTFVLTGFAHLCILFDTGVPQNYFKLRVTQKAWLKTRCGRKQTTGKHRTKLKIIMIDKQAGGPITAQ